MRRELNRLGSRKPLTDPDVVKLSQKLDHLLNQYSRLQCHNNTRHKGNRIA
ncbi:MAG: aspartyl-phosphate phosphatase Spo0E family protein [Peptococcaceae bacterium]|nr:aspartyl-phosphate phosphatase Spo0E family protein [Peptococcaceae bacterium]